jgi:hypothetical protein
MTGLLDGSFNRSTIAPTGGSRRTPFADQ